MARAMRLAVIQNQLDVGNLTEAEARELLARPLDPDDSATVVDDSEWLNQYDKNDPAWNPIEWTQIP